MGKWDAGQLIGGILAGRADCMDDSTRWIPLFLFSSCHNTFSYVITFSTHHERFERALVSEEFGLATIEVH
jgi:hypothetical protein